MQIHTFYNTDDYIKSATDAIETVLLKVSKKQEVIRVAVSGGSSPILVYQKLRERNIPWEKVEFYLVDERMVPKDHSESNERMIRKELLNNLPIRKFYSVEEYSGEMFDLVLLGMGLDGHTASLFPHAKELNEKTSLVVHTKSPLGIKDRVTLTFLSLMNSEKIIFLICGEEKKAILEKAQQAETVVSDVPAKMIMEHNNVEIYYLKN